MILIGVVLVILSVACFLRTREPTEVFLEDEVEYLDHAFISVVGVLFFTAGVVLAVVGSS